MINFTVDLTLDQLLMTQKRINKLPETKASLHLLLHLFNFRSILISNCVAKFEAFLRQKTPINLQRLLQYFLFPIIWWLNRRNRSKTMK